MIFAAKSLPLPKTSRASLTTSSAWLSSLQKTSVFGTVERHVNAQLAAICLKRGLVIYPGGGTADGVNGDHFLICPPFTIQEAELDELFGILDEALAEFELAGSGD